MSPKILAEFANVVTAVAGTNFNDVFMSAPVVRIRSRDRYAPSPTTLTPL
jgi:hypothetical protein